MDQTSLLTPDSGTASDRRNKPRKGQRSCSRICCYENQSDTLKFTTVRTTYFSVDDGPKLEVFDLIS